MTNSTSTPEIKVEIISTPALQDMTITQVGQNMFSLNLNIVTVVRFPSSAPMDTPIQVGSKSTPLTTEVSRSAGALSYTDGTVPEPGGETAAFNDFSTQHGYAPHTRDVLAEWVNLQQGGA